jgi:uncharacterized damage-inducible protein DinB
MDPLKIYDYLTKARQRVLDAVRPLTPEQYQHQFTFGLKTIGSTLTHIMISEWYYVERIEERTVPSYDQWPIKYESPPGFEIIESTWRKQAKNVRASIAAQRDWNRRITWLSFPNDEGKRFHITVTPGDLFTQLALHEVHHRSQLMVMLRELSGAGSPVQDIDYNAMMFERREATGVA